MSIPTLRFSHRRQLAALVVLATVCCLPSGIAEAAEESRAILKTYFETGDIPTEEQFSDLIDSFISRIDDGVYIGATPDPIGQGSLLGEGMEVGPGLAYAPVTGLGEDWVGASGYLALSIDINLQTHYGYLQISSPPGDQYPMFVEYLVYETDPGVPITATHVPEPAALVLLSIGSLALLRSRKRVR